MSGSDLHDAVLVFSKTWGGLYLFLVFLAAVIWAYWPTNRTRFDAASKLPLEKEDRPWR